MALTDVELYNNPQIMKRFLLILLFSQLQSYAQVGFNTTSPQEILHIDASKDNNTTGSPTNSQIANDIVFTANGSVGVGTISPAVKLDLRSSQNTDNSVGIGETTKTAAGAGAGAIRYNPYNGGKMQYSDGTKWEDLISTPAKAIVVSNIQVSPFAIKIPYQVQTVVTQWSELRDSTNNFDPTQGVFTAPRTGIYLVTFTYDFVRIPLAANYFTEARFLVNDSTIAKKCIKSHQNATLQAQVGLSCVAGIRLNRGDTLKPAIYQSVYNGALSLRTGISGTPSNDDYGFINFSIMEN